MINETLKDDPINERKLLGQMFLVLGADCVAMYLPQLLDLELLTEEQESVRNASRETYSAWIDKVSGSEAVTEEIAFQRAQDWIAFFLDRVRAKSGFAIYEGLNAWCQTVVHWCGKEGAVAFCWYSALEYLKTGEPEFRARLDLDEDKLAILDEVVHRFIVDTQADYLEALNAASEVHVSEWDACHLKEVSGKDCTRFLETYVQPLMLYRDFLHLWKMILSKFSRKDILILLEWCQRQCRILGFPQGCARLPEKWVEHREEKGPVDKGSAQTPNARENMGSDT